MTLMERFVQEYSDRPRLHSVARCKLLIIDLIILKFDCIHIPSYSRQPYTAILPRLMREKCFIGLIIPLGMAYLCLEVTQTHQPSLRRPLLEERYYVCSRHFIP